MPSLKRLTAHALRFIAWSGITVLAATCWAAGPADMTGPTRCVECHENSFDVWKNSHHFSSADSMPKASAAKEIAEKLAIKRIKDPASPCAQCHFTAAETEGRTKIVGGITCESCHGPAKGWIELHNDFGGAGIKKEQESKEHREQRLKTVEQAGMIRPGRIYEFARNCFACHLVTNEALVADGGHGVGKDFDLLDRMTGEIMHSPKPDAARKRLIKIAGYGASLEMALRGIAAASRADTVYLKTMRDRVADSHAALAEINAKAGNAAIKSALAAAAETSFDPGNKSLLSGADKVRQHFNAALQTLDGNQLAFVDGLPPVRGAKLPAVVAGKAGSSAATAPATAASKPATAPAVTTPAVTAPATTTPAVTAPVTTPAATTAVTATAVTTAPATSSKPAITTPVKTETAVISKPSAPAKVVETTSAASKLAAVVEQPAQPAPAKEEPPSSQTAPVATSAVWWLVPERAELCASSAPWRLGEKALTSVANGLPRCGSFLPPRADQDSFVYAINSNGSVQLLWATTPCGNAAAAGQEPWPTLQLPANTSKLWLVQTAASARPQLSANQLLPAQSRCFSSSNLAIDGNSFLSVLATLQKNNGGAISAYGI